MDLFMPESWDKPGDPSCASLRKETKMPEGSRYREKWRIALEQIDLARRDGVLHRAVLADSWYGNIPAFRETMDETYLRIQEKNNNFFLE